MIIPDFEIRNMIRTGELVIDPLSENSIRENGVDLRLGNEFCLLRSTSLVLDTAKQLDPVLYYDCVKVPVGEGFIIPAGRRVLATTLEYVKFPDDVIGLVNLRSTWARTGIYIPPTIIDAGFEGEVTIEIVGSEFPVKVYPGQRFLHLVLAMTSESVEKPYRGKYKGQRGVKLPVLPIRVDYED